MNVVLSRKIHFTQTNLHGGSSIFKEGKQARRPQRQVTVQSVELINGIKSASSRSHTSKTPSPQEPREYGYTPPTRADEPPSARQGSNTEIAVSPRSTSVVFP